MHDVVRTRPVTLMLAVLLTVAACGGGAPPEDGLRDAFAAQLAANGYLSDVQRNGDEITFTAPGAEGGTAAWRVVMDTAVVEPFEGDPAYSLKGTVTSTWYSDGQAVLPVGRESNLPVELTSNGLAQDCYALWNSENDRWEWE